jgi:uncharacterized protein (DUF1330 family)
VVIECSTLEALHLFLKDPDYAPYAAAPQNGTDSHFIAIDVAGTIIYLSTGS